MKKLFKFKNNKTDYTLSNYETIYKKLDNKTKEISQLIFFLKDNYPQNYANILLDKELEDDINAKFKEVNEILETNIYKTLAKGNLNEQLEEINNRYILAQLQRGNYGKPDKFHAIINGKMYNNLKPIKANNYDDCKSVIIKQTKVFAVGYKDSGSTKTRLEEEIVEKDIKFTVDYQSVHQGGYQMVSPSYKHEIRKQAYGNSGEQGTYLVEAPTGLFDEETKNLKALQVLFSTEKDNEYLKEMINKLTSLTKDCQEILDNLNSIKSRLDNEDFTTIDQELEEETRIKNFLEQI